MIGTILRHSVVLGTTGALMGASFGVLAVGFGMSPVMACTMSVVVYAGASQFVALGVESAGGSPLAAITGGMLVNSRFVPLSLAVSLSLNGDPEENNPPMSWPYRLVSSHLIVDFSAAVSIAQGDARAARRAFWISGWVLYLLYIAGTAAGAFAGAALTDPDALGLDGAYPAALLALLAPQLRQRRPGIAALAGAGIALALTPFTAPGVPVLLAVLAVAIARLVPVEREPANDPPSPEGES